MRLRGHRVLLLLFLSLSLLLAPLDSVAAKRPPGDGGASGGKATLLAIEAPAETYCLEIPVTATLTSKGLPVSGQSLSLSVDGQAAGSATTDASGVARFTASVTVAGNHQLAVSYAGGKGYGPSEASTVTKVLTYSTEVYEAADSKGQYGDPVNLSTGHGVPNAMITFAVDGTVVGQALADGSGNAHLDWIALRPAGVYAITADPLQAAAIGEIGGCPAFGTIVYIPGTLYLHPKPATLAYAGDTRQQLNSPIVLRAVVNPTGGTQGDLSKAGPVRFDLRTTPDLGTPPLYSYGSVPVDQQGVATVVTDSLPYQTYYLTILQDGNDNPYYYAPLLQVTISAPAL